MRNPPLLLIVDDDPNFLEIFSAKLASVGFHVETAVNGKEGMEKAVQLQPDLVLMDVQMPVMNGIDAFIKIKDDPANGHIKVIFLTVLGDPRQEVQEINRRLSKEIGAVGYVRKTDSLDELVESVRSILAFAG